jgi:xylulokinase
MPHLLGIDIGTSGTKTLVCDEDGTVLATAMAEHPISSPKPGWSEQNPEDWWQATCAATKAVLKNAKLKPADVGGIGLSGQMHGSVFLGDGTAALRPALLWNDQRTAEQCATIEQKAGGREALIELVANPALTGFTAPKILWLRENEPKTYAKVKHILLPKDYVRLRMTGEYATEVSDASGMLLLDVKNRTWSDKLLSLLEIDKATLGKLYESQEVTGTLHEEAAKALGLKAGIPVVGGAGDQAAGAVGNGIVSAGIVSATLGTSGVVFAHADQPTRDPMGRVHTMCHAVPGKWCVFGCMLSAGGSFQWLRNTLGQDEVAEARKKKVDPYELLILQAETAPPGCEGLFFLPYLTGERCPHPDPLARGGWVGLTARTTRRCSSARSSRASRSVCGTPWRSCGAWTSRSPRSAPAAAGPAASSGGSSRPTCTGRRSSPRTRARARRTASPCWPASAPASGRASRRRARGRSSRPVR